VPAETNQHREQIDVAGVLDLLSIMVGVEVDVDEAAGLTLDELDLHDDLALLHLWDATVEELGERAVGDLDLDGERPATLRDLAALFHAHLDRAHDEP